MGDEDDRDVAGIPTRFSGPPLLVFEPDAAAAAAGRDVDDNDDERSFSLMVDADAVAVADARGVDLLLGGSTEGDETDATAGFGALEPVAAVLFSFCGFGGAAASFGTVSVRVVVFVVFFPVTGSVVTSVIVVVVVVPVAVVVTAVIVVVLTAGFEPVTTAPLLRVDALITFGCDMCLSVRLTVMPKTRMLSSACMLSCFDPFNLLCNSLLSSSFT